MRNERSARFEVPITPSRHPRKNETCCRPDTSDVKRELTMSRDKTSESLSKTPNRTHVQAEGKKIIVVGTMNIVFLNGEIELWGSVQKVVIEL